MLDRLFIAPWERLSLGREERRARSARVGPVTRLHRQVRYQLLVRLGRLSQSRLAKRVSQPIAYLSFGPSWIAFRLGGLYEGLEERLAKSIWTRWVYYVMWVARVVAESAGGFVRAWFYSRRFKHLLGGVPAIVIFLPIAFCLLRIPSVSPAAKARHYRTAAADAWEVGDYDAVRLYNQKVQQLGVSVEKALFQTALAADEEGKTQVAYEQMTSLAEQFEYLPAKIWIVRAILYDRTDLSWDQAKPICERQLNSLLAVEPTNPMLRSLHARLLVREGRRKEAAEQLQEIQQEYPPARLQLADLQRSQQQFAASRAALLETAEHYRRRKEDGRRLDPSEYRVWATALGRLHEFGQMQQVVDQALAEYPDSQPLRKFVVEMYSSLVDRLPVDPSTAETRYQLVDRALALDPEDKGLWERLAFLLADRSLSQRVRARLDNAHRELPGNVHAAIALVAASQGNYQVARTHFEQVVREFPESASSLNDLAWLLVHTEPVELDRALELADHAVALQPDNANFRDTRGRIFLLAQRWDDAVADLRIALNGRTGQQDLHRLLSTAYQRLGKKDLAEAHRRAAQASDPHVSMDH